MEFSSLLAEDAAFESQLLQAQKRTEEFNQSVLQARQQEAAALKVLEEERKRWTASFEEKNVMIEQLQRELACTVDALSQSHQNELQEASLTSESYAPRTENTPMGKVSGVDKSNQLRSSVERRICDPRLSSDYPLDVHGNGMAVHGNGMAAQRASPGISSRFTEDKLSENSDHFEHVHKPAIPPQPSHEDPFPTELMEENRRLSGIVQDLEATLEKVKNAWRESDSRLHFRTTQV